MFFDFLKPYPGFSSVVRRYFRRNYIVESVPFGGRNCTTKDGEFKRPLRCDVMVRCFRETVFSRVSVSFKQAVVVKPGFPVAVVVTVGSHGLHIEYGFVVFWHGAKIEAASELGDVKQVIDLFSCRFR